ncbi:MAG: polysaccharide pyruvyl transferase family protein [Opitutaceae bacterium]
MRIHLGHHFYGAGNLGDDFMLAGFLDALRTLEPAATFTCCVPFAREPLMQRFPTVEWLPYEDATRSRCIERCDVWLGVGGSPFQSALSRWFIDHLVTDAGLCARARKPMFFLGVGVQTTDELSVTDARHVCSQAAGIWTRDVASAERIRALIPPPPVFAAGDLAHIFFRNSPPPPARPGCLTVVANFDCGAWTGQSGFLRALQTLPASDRIWLAQESRKLPGGERALFATLPPTDQSRWRLVCPDQPGANLSAVLAWWPSGEWLLTARYHAALAGAWAGSKIVVLATNEKLRAAADELDAPLVTPDADEDTVARALASARPVAAPHQLADRAHGACAAFLRSAVAHRR